MKIRLSPMSRGFKDAGADNGFSTEIDALRRPQILQEFDKNLFTLEAHNTHSLTHRQAHRLIH